MSDNIVDFEKEKAYKELEKMDDQFSLQHYDKEGKPLKFSEWSRLLNDMDYKIVANSKVGRWRVSTVWLGLDHGHGLTDKPLIFETMIYKTVGRRRKPEGLKWRNFQCRYSTLKEAQKGHEATIHLEKKGETGDWY